MAKLSRFRWLTLIIISILIFIIALGNLPSGLSTEFDDQYPFLYTTDVIGLSDSEREFAFPSDVLRKH